MGDDWESVTKIGRNVRATNSRETVVRGTSQLNAASRSGAVTGTERKFTNNKAGVDGQRLARIDRTDDVVGVQSVPLAIKEVVRRERDLRGWTQQKLADECKKALPLIRDLENINTKTQPQQDVLSAVENALNIKLRGKDIGSPKNLKRKEREDQERTERVEAEKKALADFEARHPKKEADEEGPAEDEEGKEEAQEQPDADA